jgi:hypothetical protein
METDDIDKPLPTIAPPNKTLTADDTVEGPTVVPDITVAPRDATEEPPLVITRPPIDNV